MLVYFKITEDLEDNMVGMEKCTWELACQVHEEKYSYALIRSYIKDGGLFSNAAPQRVKQLEQVINNIPFIKSQKDLILFEKSDKESYGAFSLRVALTLQIVREFIKVTDRDISLDEALAMGVNSDYYNISEYWVDADLVEFALTPGNLDRINKELFRESFRHDFPNTYVWEEIKYYCLKGDRDVL